MYTRGIGAYPGEPCYKSDRPGWMPHWIDTPTESVCRQAEEYSRIQYGKIPSPPPPVLAAPQTKPEMTDPEKWTPEIVAERTRQQTIDAWNKKIREMEKSGEYTPGGTLPINASGEVQLPDLSLDMPNLSWLYIAGAVVGTLLLVKAVR